MAHGHGANVQTAELSDSQWAATVAVRAEGLLLRETTRSGRASQGRAGTVTPRNAGWLAGAWDETTHEQPQRGEQSPNLNETRPRYRGQGRGGLVAPILMLHRQRRGGLHGGPYPHAA